MRFKEIELKYLKNSFHNNICSLPALIDQEFPFFTRIEQEHYLKDYIIYILKEKITYKFMKFLDINKIKSGYCLPRIFVNENFKELFYYENEMFAGDIFYYFLPKQFCDMSYMYIFIPVNGDINYSKFLKFTKIDILQIRPPSTIFTLNYCAVLKISLKQLSSLKFDEGCKHIP